MESAKAICNFIWHNEMMMIMLVNSPSHFLSIYHILASGQSCSAEFVSFCLHFHIDYYIVFM